MSGSGLIDRQALCVSGYNDWVWADITFNGLAVGYKAVLHDLSLQVCSAHVAWHNV